MIRLNTIELVSFRKAYEKFLIKKGFVKLPSGFVKFETYQSFRIKVIVTLYQKRFIFQYYLKGNKKASLEVRKLIHDMYEFPMHESHIIFIKYPTIKRLAPEMEVTWNTYSLRKKSKLKPLLSILKQNGGKCQ